MAYTRLLDAPELRILGCLMEKERTTPEQYPLTVSALLQAANQKTSREPVTDYSETEIVEALDRLRADALVFRVHGSRSERYEHCLDRRWHLDTAAAAALITMLLLRGAQTVAELKNRTARLHAFSTPDEVEAALGRLAEGPDALVRELPRQSGQRETRWIHLAGTAEVERELTAGFRTPGWPAERPAAAPGTASSPRVADTDSARLAERLERLEAAVAELGAAMSALRTRLGE
jgi:uncharacterized protein YceH (UPF0502 family)